MIQARLFRCPDAFWHHFEGLRDFAEGYLAANLYAPRYSPCDWAIDDALSIPRYLLSEVLLERRHISTPCRRDTM